MNSDTNPVDRLQALLARIQGNAKLVAAMRAAGAMAPAPAATQQTPSAQRPAPVAEPIEVPLEPLELDQPIAEPPRVDDALSYGEESFEDEDDSDHGEPILLVRRSDSDRASNAARAASSQPGRADADLHARQGSHPGPGPDVTEAEPSSSDRRAALNLEVPKAPGVPTLDQPRAFDSLEPAAAAAEEQDIEVISSEGLMGEELTTIPPSAPPAALAAEPTPLNATADFVEAPAAPPEADFARGAPPSLDEIEAPPISTEQEREEVDGLGVSLGFSARPVAPDIIQDDETHTAPRTPPPESGPQISSAPKEPEPMGLDVAPSLNVERRQAEGPTMEQLGSTVSFPSDERASAELELKIGSETPPHVTGNELEAELPAAGFSAAYDASLAPPATAREELEAHDRQERARAERRSTAPGSSPMAAMPVAPTVSPTSLSPNESVGRPAVNLTAPAALYDTTHLRPTSTSFLDRLEASLALAPTE